jgi:mannan endo-1,4-beta-mannosidase
MINKNNSLLFLRSFVQILLVASLIILSACSSVDKNLFNSHGFQKEAGIKMVDSIATKETSLLFYNLKELAEHQRIIFGHHESTAYGIGWHGQKNRSDVKDVIKKFPGLYGWDFAILRPDVNVDSMKDPTRGLVKEAYQRGGINTFCWHNYNPVTNNNFYDTTKAIYKILPGGDFYLKYLAQLDKIAEYSKTLVDSSGKLIPIIFRPFHEFDGSWFWWGKNFCTPEEFKTIFQTTVLYLRDKKGVRNFLYAFSPDRNFKSKEQFLERYPGDEYVDILGFDDYYDFNPDGDGLDWIKKKLKIITSLAEERNKIAALTETGLEGIVDDRWYTDKLYKVMDDDSIKIAFAMVWRNANTTHHYVPYAGHAGAKDFIDFSHTPKILFEDELPSIYSQKIDSDIIKDMDRKKKISIIELLNLCPIR